MAGLAENGQKVHGEAVAGLAENGQKVHGGAGTVGKGERAGRGEKRYGIAGYSLTVNIQWQRQKHIKAASMSSLTG